MEAKASEAILTGREGDDREPGAEIDTSVLANEIAVGALRYFMLKYGRNKVIAFDFNEALTFEGDSGPYLQYSTVRAENIFRKMKERGVDPMVDDASIDQLTIGGEMADDMWEVVRMSAETPAAVGRAVDALELSILTHHLLELAQRFNSCTRQPGFIRRSHGHQRRGVRNTLRGGNRRSLRGPWRRFRPRRLV
jgi:arginyl-tRNA synthetase